METQKNGGGFQEAQFRINTPLFTTDLFVLFYLFPPFYFPFSLFSPPPSSSLFFFPRARSTTVQDTVDGKVEQGDQLICVPSFHACGLVRLDCGFGKLAGWLSLEWVAIFEVIVA